MMDRLTIDEAIAHAREVASGQKRRNGECVINDNECDKFSNCIQCAEEHKQLAEWLEELKAYRENVLYRNLHEQDKKVYNKAIDDFVEKLKRENKETIPTHSGYCRMSFDEVVDEIAEQLKEGADK